MEVLLFILVAYGISNIIIFGSIFEFFRDFWETVSPNFFGKLFTCFMCLPTWVGIFLSAGAHITNLLQFSPFAYYGLDIPALAIFLDGCLASGTVWLIHTLQEHLENK